MDIERGHDMVTGIRTEGSRRRLARVSLALALLSLPLMLAAQPVAGPVWSTYVGGAGDDWVSRAVFDSEGMLYVTGGTSSAGWIAGGGDTFYSGSGDGYVAKVDADGKGKWATYLGYTDGDSGTDIAVDAAGNVLVTGYTESDEWVQGGMVTTHSGGFDGFLVKLAPDGTHLWSTFLGGSGGDWATGVAVDDTGVIYVTGMTASGTWTLPLIEGKADPVPVEPLVPFAGGSHDAFLIAFAANGDLLWFTYVGGNDSDAAYGLAPIPGGGVMLSGVTRSATGWINRGADPSYNGGDDAFVARFEADGTRGWSSYLGGSGNDGALCVAVGPSGNVHVGGDTWSAGWTSGGADLAYGGSGDGFCATFDATGTLLWSTYMGGPFQEAVRGLAVDADGQVLAVGFTESGGWIEGGFDTTYGGNRDGFALKMDEAGGILWSTYLGKYSIDSANGALFNAAGDAVVVGETGSPGWIAGGGDTSFNGGSDGYLFVISDAAVLIPYVVEMGPAQVALGRGLWDVSGHYETILEGFPLTFDLLHAASGKLQGTGILTIPGGDKGDLDVPVILKGTVKGKTKGAAGTVVVSFSAKGRLKGTPGDPSAKVAAAIKAKLMLDADSASLAGEAAVKVKSGTVKEAFSSACMLLLPAGMDGTYDLFVNVNQVGSSLSGHGALYLSNGTEFGLTVSGTQAGETSVLTLGGDRDDPSAKGIKIKTSLELNPGGSAAVLTFSGKVLGQSQAW